MSEDQVFALTVNAEGESRTRVVVGLPSLMRELTTELMGTPDAALEDWDKESIDRVISELKDDPHSGIDFEDGSLWVEKVDDISAATAPLRAQLEEKDKELVKVREQKTIVLGYMDERKMFTEAADKWKQDRDALRTALQAAKGALEEIRYVFIGNSKLKQIDKALAQISEVME